MDAGRLLQALQWQCHYAGLSLSRGSFDCESEQEGSEEEGERVAELHCDGGLSGEDKRRTVEVPGDERGK